MCLSYIFLGINTFITVTVISYDWTPALVELSYEYCSLLLFVTPSGLQYVPKARCYNLLIRFFPDFMWEVRY